MTNFDRLHPALQHHVVNSLGWRELRPFQEAVIPQVLDGKHLIVLAPTAGGKTEAAFFPIVSRMLSEGWTGLSVLYICPIKALLNNLDLRLQRYCSLLGRQSALWHGDVKASAKKRTLREGDSLAKPVGKMLKNVFEMAREDGVFEKLPLTQKAILFIENVDNEFAWPTGKKPARIRRQPR